MLHQALLPTLLPFVLQTVVSAVPTAHNAWYQPADSHVAALFQKRYIPNPSDASEYSPPSSFLRTDLSLPDFSSNYPPVAYQVSPPVSSIPAAWLAALASASIPNISVAIQNNGYPKYANNESGTDSTICSFTYSCIAPTDLLDPPAGVVAVSSSMIG